MIFTFRLNHDELIMEENMNRLPFRLVLCPFDQDLAITAKWIVNDGADKAA